MWFSAGSGWRVPVLGGGQSNRPTHRQPSLLPQFPPVFCTNPELGVGTAMGQPLRARGTSNHMLDRFSDPLSVSTKQVCDVTQGAEGREQHGGKGRDKVTKKPNHKPQPSCFHEIPLPIYTEPFQASNCNSSITRQHRDSTTRRTIPSEHGHRIPPRSPSPSSHRSRFCRTLGSQQQQQQQH